MHTAQTAAEALEPTGAESDSAPFLFLLHRLAPASAASLFR
jgi:hypothetical protein